ncbi:hypothetical protein BSL78_00626 [Apostichopus japonicus]|uniref:non-specific serine/threonine protein kinase n=1 Tax=Stichopus japonicus TaxID=307972 RepID=A0A2G8LQ78_STIJA|nr:hypothetical protein BSL78_00626 [Apostichopus japonicus]
MIIRRIIEEGTSDRYRDGEFSKDYEVLNELGRGRFAVVRRCEHRTTKQDFAAKFIRKRKMGKDCKEDILKEIRILEMSTDQPRLIGLHEIYETNTEVILVLEFAIGGELHPYCVAERDGPIKEGDAVRLLFQILQGVKYLHDQNIVHLDLKPQNILLTNEEIRQGDIKLIDFGIAKWLEKDLEVREIVGTVDYVAPEVLNFEPISFATDMWSVGVVAYVMLTGVSPFTGDTKQETYLNISQGNLDFPEEYFKDVSLEAQDFIKALCVIEPENRLTAADCINHPIFRSKHLSDGCSSTSIESDSHQEEAATTSENKPDMQILELNNSLNNGFRRLMGLAEECSGNREMILSDDNSNKLIVSSQCKPGEEESRTAQESSDTTSSQREQIPDENHVMRTETSPPPPAKEQRTITPSSSIQMSSTSETIETEVVNVEPPPHKNLSSDYVNQSNSDQDKEQQRGEFFTFNNVSPNKVIGSMAEKLHGYHKGDSPFSPSSTPYSPTSSPYSPSSSPYSQRRILHHGKENIINDSTPEPKRCKMEV